MILLRRMQHAMEERDRPDPSRVRTAQRLIRHWASSGLIKLDTIAC
jgi:hypothetical protein